MPDLVTRQMLRARNGLAYLTGANRPAVAQTPRDLVWQRDKARLWRYRSGQRCYGPPALIVHRRDEAPRHGSIGWIRQWIESVNDTLKGQLDLERHGGRTTEGIYTRISSGCWLWPPASGTTGPPANPPSDR